VGPEPAQSTPDHDRGAKRMQGPHFMRLLALLLVMIAVTPVMEEFLRIPFLEEVLFTAIFAYSIYSLGLGRRLMALGLCLAIPAVLFIWLGVRRPESGFALASHLCGAGFIALIVFLILRHIFRRRDVDADTIAASIVAYLLMAVMWGLVYQVIHILIPGSFHFPAGTEPNPTVFRYFSLVTITTVGYGDMVPLSKAARGFANLEAVVGQIYLVILVSWLVGMYVSARAGRR